MDFARSFPTFGRMFRGNQVVNSFSVAAKSFFRGMRITRYYSHVRKRQLAVANRNGESVAKATVFIEQGRGDVPTIVVGGFVPNSTEAVEFQREILRSWGNIYYVNYAQQGFSSEMLQAQIGDLIEDLNRRGEKPVLFGVSFGCGVIKSFLQSQYSTGLNMKGLVMVSPVLCKEDLVRPAGDSSGGVRMLESILRKIIAVDPSKVEDVRKQVERARKCFQALFEAGAANRVLSARHLSIRRRVMESVGNTPVEGGYQRVLALTDFAPVRASQSIFNGPALILLAETENDLLAPSSPTLRVLAHPESRREVFPLGKVKVVSSPNSDDPVPHASLIFHHHCYNSQIETWYERHNQKLLLAVA